jgi:hypothetical protein
MVFTFLFFMLKISVNRLSEYNKSYRIFHNESNKIRFAFELSTIFYEFLKMQQFTTTIGDEVLHRGPWKECKPCNVAPGCGGRCSRRNSGEIR